MALILPLGPTSVNLQLNNRSSAEPTIASEHCRSCTIGHAGGRCGREAVCRENHGICDQLCVKGTLEASDLSMYK